MVEQKNHSSQFNVSSHFLQELSELMEKHKAALIIERVWDNEYDSHAELDFMIDGVFIQGNFFASPLKEINSDDIIKLLPSQNLINNTKI